MNNATRYNISEQKFLRCPDRGDEFLVSRRFSVLTYVFLRPVNGLVSGMMRKKSDVFDPPDLCERRIVTVMTLMQSPRSILGVGPVFLPGENAWRREGAGECLPKHQRVRAEVPCSFVFSAVTHSGS